MEWEKIDQWLLQKYAPQPVPLFERNEESFRILRNMMEANQDQDARAKRVLEDMQLYANIYQAEGERLQTANRVFGLDKSQLSPQASSQLDHMVDLAMMLGLDSVSLPSFQLALVHHLGQYTSAIQAEGRAKTLQARLDEHLTDANATLHTLQHHIQPQLTSQWEEIDQVQIKIWQRHVDLLHEKVIEYQSQLEGIHARRRAQQRSSDGHHNDDNSEAEQSLNAIRLGNLHALQTSVQDLERQIDDRNQALAAYTELPPDYKLARLKLSEAKFQLEQLLIEQESLMQDLADGL